MNYEDTLNVEQNRPDTIKKSFDTCGFPYFVCYSVLRTRSLNKLQLRFLIVAGIAH